MIRTKAVIIQTKRSDAKYFILIDCQQAPSEEAVSQMILVTFQPWVGCTAAQVAKLGIIIDKERLQEDSKKIPSLINSKVDSGATKQWLHILDPSAERDNLLRLHWLLRTVPHAADKIVNR